MKFPKNATAEKPDLDTPEGAREALRRLTNLVEGHRQALIKIRKEMPTDERMAMLSEKIRHLSEHAQQCLTKGAIFTELEIMLRDAPLSKRSEMFQALAWGWDNLPPDTWRKMHVLSLDACLHTLITTFRARKK